MLLGLNKRLLNFFELFIYVTSVRDLRFKLSRTYIKYLLNDVILPQVDKSQGIISKAGEQQLAVSRQIEWSHFPGKVDLAHGFRARGSNVPESNFFVLKWKFQLIFFNVNFIFEKNLRICWNYTWDFSIFQNTQECVRNSQWLLVSFTESKLSEKLRQRRIVERKKTKKKSVFFVRLKKEPFKYPH